VQHQVNRFKRRDATRGIDDSFIDVVERWRYIRGGGGSGGGGYSSTAVRRYRLTGVPLEAWTQR
jgi:hypothetical protein